MAAGHRHDAAERLGAEQRRHRRRDLFGDMRGERLRIVTLDRLQRLDLEVADRAAPGAQRHVADRAARAYRRARRQRLEKEGGRRLDVAAQIAGIGADPPRQLRLAADPRADILEIDGVMQRSGNLDGAHLQAQVTLAFLARLDDLDIGTGEARAQDARADLLEDLHEDRRDPGQGGAAQFGLAGADDPAQPGVGAHNAQPIVDQRESVAGGGLRLDFLDRRRADAETGGVDQQGHQLLGLDAHEVHDRAQQQLRPRGRRRPPRAAEKRQFETQPLVGDHRHPLQGPDRRSEDRGEIGLAGGELLGAGDDDFGPIGERQAAHLRGVRAGGIDEEHIDPARMEQQRNGEVGVESFGGELGLAGERLDHATRGRAGDIVRADARHIANHSSHDVQVPRPQLAAAAPLFI